MYFVMLSVTYTYNHIYIIIIINIVYSNAEIALFMKEIARIRNAPYIYVGICNVDISNKR